MRNARPKSRRWIEAAADDLDFDYFADATGMAGDGALAETFDGVADLVDLYAEIDAELDAPIAPVVTLPIATPRQLGEVA